MLIKDSYVFQFVNSVTAEKQRDVLPLSAFGSKIGLDKVLPRTCHFHCMFLRRHFFLRSCCQPPYCSLSFSWNTKGFGQLFWWGGGPLRHTPLKTWELSTKPCANCIYGWLWEQCVVSSLPLTIEHVRKSTVQVLEARTYACGKEWWRFQTSKFSLSLLTLCHAF